MKSLFAGHGIPKTPRADNMPFGSKELYQFCREWEFEIITSSPEYPKSNGLAEKGVQVIKKLIKKFMDSKQDINLALLAFRSAPNEQGLSPAQLLFGRQIRSKLPVLEQNLTGRYDNKNQEDKKATQEKQRKYHDLHAKQLPKLERGDSVRIGSKDGWNSVGKVIETNVGPRSYLVDTGKRRVHLRNIPDKHEESSKEFVSDDENILVDNEILDENNTTISENDNSPKEHGGLPLGKEVRQSSPSPQKKESKRIRKSARRQDFEYY